MQQILSALEKCSLFHDLSQEELLEILNNTKYTSASFRKGQIIAFEDDPCTTLGIVLVGKVEVQRVYYSGKVVTLAVMEQGSIFGEAIVFTKTQRYPATIVAAGECRIIFIAADDIIRLCASHQQVLRRFIEHLSTKILLLNKKIKDLSFDTLRQKIAMYLLEEYRRQKRLDLVLPTSKKNLADYLGVQRPSLSRELINMHKDGLLDLQRNKILLLDLEALEDLVL